MVYFFATCQFTCEVFIKNQSFRLLLKLFLFFCSKLYFIPSIIVHKSLPKLLKLPQNTTGKWHKQGITQSSTKLITVFFCSKAMPILASSDTKKKDCTIVARKISQPLSIDNWVPHSGMLLYLHHINSKLFFHPAKFDNFKDEKISDNKTVSVSQHKNLFDWKL